MRHSPAVLPSRWHSGGHWGPRMISNCPNPIIKKCSYINTMLHGRRWLTSLMWYKLIDFLRPLVFLDVTWHKLVVGYWCFMTTYQSSSPRSFELLDPWRWYLTCYPEMSVTNYQRTMHNIPEGERPQLPCSGSLKSPSVWIFVLLYLLCRFKRECVIGFMGFYY